MLKNKYVPLGLILLGVVCLALYAWAQQRDTPGSNVLLVDDPFDGEAFDFFAATPAATAIQISGSIATDRTLVVGSLTTCDGLVAAGLSFDPDAARRCLFVDHNCNETFDGADFCLGSNGNGGGGVSTFSALDLEAGVGGLHTSGGRMETQSPTLAPEFEATITNPLELSSGGVVGTLGIDVATQALVISGGTDGDAVAKANGATRKYRIQTPDGNDCLTVDPVSGIVLENLCQVERVLSLQGAGLTLPAAHESQRNIGVAIPTRTALENWVGIPDDGTFELSFSEDTHPAILDTETIDLVFTIWNTVAAVALRLDCGVQLVGPGAAPADPVATSTQPNFGTLTANVLTQHTLTITPTNTCGGDPTKCRMFGRCVVNAGVTNTPAPIPMISLRIVETISGV